MTEDDLALFAKLVTEVSERKAVADAAAKASTEAITASREASAHLSAGVGVLRELVAALTDGAGYDGRHPLKVARELAVALLAEEAG